VAVRLSKSLKLLVMAVVVTAITLFGACVVLWSFGPAPTLVGEPDVLVFWTVVALVVSSFPVRTPRGSIVSVSIAPILASAILGGPVAAGIVGFVGTLEVRELRGDIPWYGTLYNHCSSLISSVLAGLALVTLGGWPIEMSSAGALLSTMAAGFVYFAASESLSAVVVALRQGRSVRAVATSDVRSYGLAFVGLTPLAWLMALAYSTIGPWVVLLFALPLYTTRASYQSVVEVRKMFTQTVRALASAIDARDPSTKRHSEHVSSIAVEIGVAMRVSEAELEQLEWGGLLHDIGKIGVRDAVLLKPGRLDRKERMAMNAHPWKGYEILQGVDRLKPELQIILHHHQWYNGSGYTGEHRIDPVTGEDRPVPGLIGEAIPFLARILHVADAFEAMTAVRPYRLRPLTTSQALDELRKYAGIQFDPRVVEAFARTKAAQPTDPEPVPEATMSPIPMLGQVAARRSQGTVSATVPLQTESP